MVPLSAPPCPPLTLAPDPGALPVPYAPMPANSAAVPRAIAPPIILHSLIGRAAMDVFRRPKSIAVGVPLQSGIVKATASHKDDEIKSDATLFDAYVKPLKTEDAEMVIKELCVSFEPSTPPAHTPHRLQPGHRYSEHTTATCLQRLHPTPLYLPQSHGQLLPHKSEHRNSFDTSHIHQRHPLFPPHPQMPLDRLKENYEPPHTRANWKHPTSQPKPQQPRLRSPSRKNCYYPLNPSLP